MVLRCEAQAVTAQAISDALEGHNKLERSIYPFSAKHPQHDLAKKQMSAGGTVVTFDIAGGKEGAFKFLNALQIVTMSNNLGDAKSLVTHPATTTHQRLSDAERDALGITDGMVRISVGLEDMGDLIADIQQALAAV